MLKGGTVLIGRTRQQLLDWAERGNLEEQGLIPALRLSGALPDGQQWRRFMDALLTGLGALLLATGVIFFFAYNWNDLGRFEKFGLIELLILASLVAMWWLDLDSIAGRVTLPAASVLVGALLALVGQTYQTGADPWELFAAWAVMILPWVLVSCTAVMWLLWLLLLNLACYLYFVAIRGLLGSLFDHDFLWPLFAINTLAWGLWEIAARQGITWLQRRWAIRILATASGSLLTLLAILATVLNDGGIEATPTLLLWAVSIAGTYLVYRRLYPDVYILAVGLLSVVLVVATFIGDRTMVRHFDAGAFLLVGMVIIVLSGLGASWLRKVAREGGPDAH